jgi:drug/metabolite transporter (DMT)-like permease
MAPSTAGAWRIAGGSVLLVAWSAVQRADLGALSGDAWMWIGVSGVLLTAYVATWFAALARAPAIDVTAVLTLGALVSSVISVVRGLQPVGAVAPGSLLLVAGALALLAGSRRTVEPIGSTELVEPVVRSP